MGIVGSLLNDKDDILRMILVHIALLTNVLRNER